MDASLTRHFTGAVGGAAALLVLPLLALIAFAAPQADDFCLAAYRGEGVFIGVLDVWREWSGRLIANALVMIPFALADEAPGILAAYRVILFALMAAWFAVACAAMRLWIAAPRQRFWMGALFAAAFLLWAPNYRELAIWLPAAATYVTPSCALAALFLLLFTPILRRFENRDAAPAPAIAWIGAGAASAVASLANEFSGVAAIFFALAATFARRAQGAPARPLAHAAIIIIAAAGLGAVLSAPGNALRMEHFDESASLGLTLAYTPLYALEFLAYHAIMPSHIVWYAALAVIASQAPTFANRTGARRAALLIVAATIGAAILAYAAGLWGTDNRLPGRAQNQLHLTAAVAFSTALVLFLRAGAKSPIIDALRAATERAPRAAVLAFWVLLAANPYTYSAFATISSGDAARFFYEARTRLEILATAEPGASVVLPRYAARPGLLLSYDLPPGMDNNPCYADAFGLSAAASGL